MAYFQTDDIPQSFATAPKSLLNLINPTKYIILQGVKSWEIRKYYKDFYAPLGSNGKRIWREELTKLGYKIENVQP